MLVPALLQKDWLQMKGWFATHTGVKALVMMGFFGVLAMVAAGIYAFSRSFFLILTNHDVFGEAVALYTLNAAMLVLLSISILTSVLASLHSLYRDSSLKHLFSLPISSLHIFVSQSIRTMLVSSWAALIVLVPVLLGYAFAHPEVTGLLWRGLLVIVLVIGLSQAVGSGLSVLIAYIFGRVSRTGMVVLAAGVMVSILLIGKLLFPSNFFRLYDAPNWDVFQSQLGQLPLVSLQLPSNWMASTLTQGLSHFTVLLVVLTVIVILTAYEIGLHYYRQSYSRAQETMVLASNSSGGMRKTRFPFLGGQSGPLIINDLLWLTRSSHELVYFIFILGLGIAYYLLIATAPITRVDNIRWLELIYVSAIVGFGYLVTVLAGRFMYPLMAKDGKAAWFIFGAPLPRWKIFDAKMVVSLLMLIPWILLGVAVASGLTMPWHLTASLGLILVMLALTISVVNVGLGTISPNFAEADRPDSTSTSLSGLMALVISLALVGLGAMVWLQFLNGSKLGLGVWVLGGGLLMALVVGWSLRSIKRYQL